MGETLRILEAADPIISMKWPLAFALILLFSVTYSANLHTDLAGGLIDLPGRMTADLGHWPFGTNEKNYTKQIRQRGGMSFLRRAVNDGFPTVAKWRDRLKRIRHEPVLNQLTLVNALVNTIPYVPDNAKEWKHPRVFLSEGGDCDCASVAKYVLLRDLGFAAIDLRIALLRIRGDKRLHAANLVRTGSGNFELFLLDIRSDAVRTALYADEYTPLVSMNEDGVWLHNETGKIFIQRFANPVIKEP